MASSELQRRLDRAQEKFGPDAPITRLLREQIARDERGQSAQELYLTGSVARQKDVKPEPEQQK